MPGCPLDTDDNEAISAAQHFFESSQIEWIVVLDDVTDLDEVCCWLHPMTVFYVLAGSVQAITGIGGIGKVID